MGYKSSSRRADRVRRYVKKDGTVVEYRYPAQSAKVASNALAYPPGSLGELIHSYQQSPQWARLRDVTKNNYRISIARLEVIGELPLSALTRTLILDMQDRIFTASGHGSAFIFTRFVCTLLNWAVDRGKIPFNPAQRIQAPAKLGAWPTWTEGEYRLALAHLPEHLRRVVVLASWTGQRNSDLCSMTWSQVSGGRLRLTQQKTEEPVSIPLHPELAAELERWRKDTVVGQTILVNRKGRPWTQKRLSILLARALRAIPGLRPNLNVHGLRKLMATRLAELGATPHEIAAVTGHRTLAMVAHYTRDVERERLANSAINRFDKIGTNGTKKRVES